MVTTSQFDAFTSSFPRRRESIHAAELGSRLRARGWRRSSILGQRVHTPLFTFKPTLAAQWPEVWIPLRVEFIRFCEQCVNDLGAPPIIITCLGRTPAQNSAVGGIASSLHMAKPCRAIDIRRRGFDQYAEAMKSLWQSRGVGWDFVIKGAPYNRKPPHFHLEADWRVR